MLQAAFACNFIRNEFPSHVLPEDSTDTEKTFSYLRSNFFVDHLRDKCSYNELVTATFFIKKRDKFFK